MQNEFFVSGVCPAIKQGASQDAPCPYSTLYVISAVSEELAKKLPDGAAAAGGAAGAAIEFAEAEHMPYLLFWICLAGRLNYTAAGHHKQM